MMFPISKIMFRSLSFRYINSWEHWMREKLWRSLSHFAGPKFTFFSRNSHDLTEVSDIFSFFFVAYFFLFCF